MCNYIFSLEERVSLAREILSAHPNVRVMGFTGLLSDFLDNFLIFPPVDSF